MGFCCLDQSWVTSEGQTPDTCPLIRRHPRASCPVLTPSWVSHPCTFQDTNGLAGPATPLDPYRPPARQLTSNRGQGISGIAKGGGTERPGPSLESGSSEATLDLEVPRGYSYPRLQPLEMADGRVTFHAERHPQASSLAEYLHQLCWGQLFLNVQQPGRRKTQAEPRRWGAGCRARSRPHLSLSLPRISPRAPATSHWQTQLPS